MTVMTGMTGLNALTVIPACSGLDDVTCFYTNLS